MSLPLRGSSPASPWVSAADGFDLGRSEELFEFFTLRAFELAEGVGGQPGIVSDV